MNDLSLVTKESYDRTAELYADNVKNIAPIGQREEFFNLLKNLLKKGARILDLGCGSGRDAKAFSEMGLHVTGIDFSSELLKIAQLNAPSAIFYLMDINSLLLPESSFEGVWASASLLHVEKAGLKHVLQRISHVLKPHGIFYLSVKKGTGEGLERDPRYGNTEKFFSYFSEEEIQSYLEQSSFNVLSITTDEKPSLSYHTHPWIRVFCKRSTK